MGRDLSPHHEQSGESQEIRRLAAACFLEEIDPRDLGCEERHLIALQREVAELRTIASSEAYLRCLSELTKRPSLVEAG